MRLEFTRKVRKQIVDRATNAAGLVTCEGCGLVLGKKPYEVDHILPEAFRDHTRREPLTAADGQLLGRACCHAPKTATDIRNIREAQRRRDKDSGAYVRRGPPMAGSKRSGWKKPFYGPAERRPAPMGSQRNRGARGKS